MADGARLFGYRSGYLRTPDERARTLVPGARFIQSDMADVSFADGTFDAIISLYALIHLPVDEQPGVLSREARSDSRSVPLDPRLWCESCTPWCRGIISVDLFGRLAAPYSSW
jgi:hypothetical protein